MSKNLVVVDVQKMFEGYFNQDYLNSVRSYVEHEKWDNIIVIYNEKEYRDEEENLEYIPDWLLKQATYVIPKYNISCLYDHYVDDLIKSGYTVEKENTAWRKEDSLFIRTPSVHELFVVPKLLQTVTRKMNDCILIGGATGYCVADIQVALEYLNVHVHLHEPYTYSLGPWKVHALTEQWVHPKKEKVTH